MRAGDLVADRFLIERFVDSGGMGSVYRALDRTTGRSVALKSLLVRDPGGVERFEREAAVLETLRHPGIVSYAAHGKADDGTPYLAMEWLDGEDLATRLDRAGLTASEALALGVQLAEALDAAHDHGIVHRDVKPANVFLVGGDVASAKLLDFGIARLQGAARALTGTGVVMGTLGYMAPEQARGDLDLDHRVDVFALGCVLFECLAGRPAYAAERGLAMLASILLEDPPLLSEVAPEVPSDLQDLIARAMSRERTQRPAMAAVSAALRGLPPPDAPAPARGGSKPAGITASEQRFASVILIAPEPGAMVATAETVAAGDASSPPRPVTDAVARHGGRVEQLADGTLAACFANLGMPTDQAAQAARCSLALYRQMPRRAVVLATGRSVLTGRVPLGEVLDRGARMLAEQAQPAGQAAPERHSSPDGVASGSSGVRIDAVTTALLGDRFLVRPHGTTAVLLAESWEQGPSRTLLGRSTPCVGRERELRMLEGMAQACFEGGGAAAVLVSAPPGMGKSRMTRELCEALRRSAPGLEIWRADADLLSRGSPLAMMASLVRRTAGASAGEPREARAKKLRERAARRLAPERAEWAAAFLGELIDAPSDPKALYPPLAAQLLAARADPQQASREAQRAFAFLLEADCMAGPVLIVLEDLHWCDRATVERIDEAFAAQRDRPLMVLALARPEVTTVHPDLWKEHGVTELRLRELPSRAAGDLVRAVLGPTVPEATVTALVARAGGNAFFLEELIRSAAEGGAGNIDALPDTVLAMLEARLGALGDRARRVLRAASIFGDAFWSGGVSALTGNLEAGALQETLDDLVRREVLTTNLVSRYAGDQELVFRHALLREAAYDTLPDEDRRLGHKLAAAWLSARGEDDPQLLAAHLERGAFEPGDRLQAAAMWARAGQRASDRCAYPDALAHYDRALSLLGTTPTPATAPIELAIRLGRGSAVAAMRGYAVAEVEVDFQRALEMAQALGDGPQLFRALIGLYSFSVLRSRFDTAREIGERCLRIARAAGDVALEFEAYRPLYSVACFVGETATSKRYIGEAASLLEQVAKRPQPVMVSVYTEVALWFFESLFFWVSGDLDRSLVIIRRSVEFAEARRHAFSIAFALYGEALIRRMRDEVPETLVAAERVHALSDEYAFPWLRNLGLAYRGWAEARLGQPDVGLPRMRDALAALKASGATMTVSDVQCSLAECCIAEGRFEEAGHVLDAAARLAAETGGVVVEPERMRLSAIVDLARRSDAAAGDAVATLEGAMALAKKHEAPILVVRVARTLASALVRAGRPADARRVLEESLAPMRELASIADIAYARAELAALRA